MKRQRFLIAATFIGLSAPFLMSTTAPVLAQSYPSPQYQRPDHGPYDDHGPNQDYGRGYPSYPRMQSMRRMNYLAENVERAAVQLEQDTFIRRDALTWQERRALGQIQALTGAASHFRAQVQSYQRDPAHTQADFERLVRAYYTAGQALDTVEATGRARTDYQNVRVRMDELMRNYGGPSRWSRYDSSHGPYTSSHGPYTNSYGPGTR